MLQDINLNFNAAIRQAKGLEDIAYNVEYSAKKIDESMNNVKSAWQSDSSVEYLRKCLKVKGDINTVSKNLRAIAGAIRIIAKEVWLAEEKAIDVANQSRLS